MTGVQNFRVISTKKISLKSVLYYYIFTSFIGVFFAFGLKDLLTIIAYYSLITFIFMIIFIIIFWKRKTLVCKFAGDRWELETHLEYTIKGISKKYIPKYEKSLFLGEISDYYLPEYNFQIRLIIPSETQAMSIRLFPVRTAMKNGKFIEDIILDNFNIEFDF